MVHVDGFCTLPKPVLFYLTSEVRTVNYRVRPEPIVPNGVILAPISTGEITPVRPFIGGPNISVDNNPTVGGRTL